MSASEKLKALAELVEHPAGAAFGLQRMDVAIPLSRALPQIVAVVEAAEEVAARVPSIARPIPTALSALDEALS